MIGLPDGTLWLADLESLILRRPKLLYVLPQSVVAVAVIGASLPPLL